jgi:hypothetical protein
MYDLTENSCTGFPVDPMPPGKDLPQLRAMNRDNFVCKPVAHASSAMDSGFEEEHEWGFPFPLCQAI